MRILCGIASPTRGRVLVDGCDLADARVRRALKRTLGYLPQDIEPYPNLTPPEFLDYVGVLKGMDDARERRRQAAELLERVGLADVARRRIGGFSGGMRRRVGIAQALMGDPRLLVVDEPTAGLDPEERMRFRTLLATLGGERTVILSTHILDDVAQTCPYVCVLRGGHVRYDGATADLVGEARGRTWLTPPLCRAARAGRGGERGLLAGGHALSSGGRCPSCRIAAGGARARGRLHGPGVDEPVTRSAVAGCTGYCSYRGNVRLAPSRTW